MAWDLNKKKWRIFQENEFKDDVCKLLIKQLVILSHDDVIKWKHFLHYWPVWGASTGHRWIPLTQASDMEL